MFWCRQFIQNCFKKRIQIYRLVFQFMFGNSIPADCIQYRKLKLILSCVQVNEEIIYFIQNFWYTSVLSINFIDHNQNLFLAFKGFFQHKPCLRQRSFRGINQQNRAINHHQGTLHFSAKIRMTGSVKYIDFSFIPGYGAVFRGNGDSPLAFQIHAVHDAFIYKLIFTEESALPEHLINECGFSMINMGNDG